MVHEVHRLTIKATVTEMQKYRVKLKLNGPSQTAVTYSSINIIYLSCKKHSQRHTLNQIAYRINIK